MRTVYLDNNATTRIDEPVLEAMLPYLTERWGNPSSMYRFGGDILPAIERAREQVAALLNARPSEIVFTSCGTESDNAAIRGVLDASPDKRHIVTTKVEHPAVLNLAHAQRRRGYEVTELSVDHEGRLNLDELRQAIRPDTAIVSVMWANNETGVVFPVAAAGEICRERGVPFHTDAVQAAGKLPIDLSRTPVDLLAISGHKLHAPKGIGALYIRRGTLVRPLIVGGHQERNRRGGTENVPYIAGLGRAAELAAAHLNEETTRVRALRDRLEEFILSNIPDTHVNGSRDERLPNTTNIGFDFIEGEAILLSLDRAGICASSGSACTSGSLNPSHVLRAMGIPFTRVHGSTRFSLSRDTTGEDIDRVSEVLPGIVERLRALSPFKSMEQINRFGN